MRARALLPRALIVGVAVLVVAYDPGPSHGPVVTADSTVQAGRLAGMQGLGRSVAVFQNASSDEDLTLEGRANHQHPRPGAGQSHVGFNFTRTAPAGGMAFMGFNPELVPGAYSAITRGDGPFAAVVRTEWQDTGAVTIYTVPSAGTDVLLPLVVKQAFGQTSLVTIQNTDPDEAATVQVALVRRNESEPFTRPSFQIEPGRSITLHLGENPAFRMWQPGSVGAMRIRSSKPVAVHSFVDVEWSQMAVYDFEGVPFEEAAERLYAPLVRNDHYGTTAVTVMNAGPEAADVTVTYRGTAGSCAGQTIVHGGRPHTLPPGASAIFHQGIAGHDLPTGFSGLPEICTAAATVEAEGGRVAAVVVDNEGGQPPATSAAYNAISVEETGTKVMVPVFLRVPSTAKRSTCLVMMNVGARTADVALTVTDTDGNIVGRPGPGYQLTIEPGVARQWCPASIPGDPDAFSGSAVLDSDQPLAVVVRESSVGGTAQLMDEALYTGIRADDFGDGPQPSVDLPILLNGVEALPQSHPQPVRGSDPSSISYYLYAGGKTGIQIQNLDPAQAANMVADFYDVQGGPPTSIMPDTIPAGAAANIYLPAEPELTGEEYGVIIAADRLVSAVARREWEHGRGAVAYSRASPDTDVIVPLAMKRYSDQSSFVAVQNTDPSASADYELMLYQMGERDPLMTAQGRIPPGTVVTHDLDQDSTFADVPDGFLGWMRVQSATPLAAHSFVFIGGSPDVVYAFEGTSEYEAGNRLFAPLVRREFYGTSGISVVNPSTTDAEVTVRFHGSGIEVGSVCAGRTYIQGPVTVPASASAVFYQGDVDLPLTGRTPLPAGCLGSATIESTGAPVVAIVNDATGGWPPATAAAYNAFSEAYGSKHVALPLVRSRHTSAELSTGVQVMNVGRNEARVTLTPKMIDCMLIGCGPACDATIAPGESHTFYLPDIPAVGHNSLGSATIESTEPVVVIVNDVSLTGDMDAAIYSGIKADWPDEPWP